MFYNQSLLMLAIGLAFLGAPALADSVSIIKGDPTVAYTGAEAPLHLTPDRSELIRLPRSAASVIVGNPAHISVLAESANTLVVVPLAAGASHFTALDEHGDIILQRHVIVASPQKNYIRVRRTCAKGSEDCQDTSVYYCPDMCHPIVMGGGAGGSGGTAPATEVSSDDRYNDSAAPAADTL